MKKTAGLIGGIICAILAAGWVGYHFGEGWLSKPGESVTVKAIPTPAQDVREAVTTSEPVSAQSARDDTPSQARQERPLVYYGWKADMSGDVTKACLEFSAPISASNVAVLDYIETKPAAKLSASVIRDRVCLSGFDFAKEYTVTVKSGLAGEGVTTLKSDRKAEINFGDKPKFVGFAGDGIILPRIGAQGLAIETVNVDSLSVEISRVSDRIIARRDPQSGQATMEGDYSWEYQNAATNVRQSIWKGEVDVKNERNQTVTTVVPVSELIGELTPGAYVITAERKRGHNDNRPARAWRWIISTDLALTTYQGASGLDVTVRSIDSAKAVGNTRVTLIAQNNDLLGEVTTDRNGHAKFAKAMISGKGSNAPKMVMAYGKGGDYAMLDLSRAPLDLSDRNIGGRAVAGDIDAYAYPDRGVYRPGETANLTAMLRNAQGKAEDRDGKLVIKKPNGLEARTERFTELKAGTLVYGYDIPASAPRGVWTADIFADGLGRIGGTKFSVEDFIPQKITVDLDAPETPLTADNEAVLKIDTQFLYGAPGKDLESEAEMRVRIDPKPFPKFKDYHFGISDESFQERLIPIGQALSDEKGVTKFTYSLKGESLETNSPLRGEIVAGVAEPGGRYVQNSVIVPIRTNDLYLGIKPRFDDDRAQRNTPAVLDIAAVTPLGEGMDAKVQWRLVEEDWRYHWYRRSSNWRYRYDVRDIDVSEGEVDVTASKPASVSPRLDWGRYRLIVTDPKSGAEASYRFSIGWGGANTSDAPDKLTLAGPTEAIRGGQNATLTLNAPYAGVGELIIASDRVHEVRSISVPKGGSEISLRMDEKWGAGVYAMITLYTPRQVKDRPIPRRAVGVTYLPLNVEDKTLTVAIGAPELIRPREGKTIKVKLTGKLTGNDYVTLAAIDEGILRLTKYDSPSPEDFYFGKTALGVELRDDYARLLNANLGAPTIAKSGGDGLGGEGLTVTPTKIVSLFGGAKKAVNGQAEFALDIPDFNGELRLMAVAWNDRAIGSHAQPMTVRDKVPADLALPRFLAPGDTAIATVSLDNVEGAKGAYAVDVAANFGLDVKDAKASLTLDKGERKSDGVTLSALTEGISELTMGVNGPANYSVQSTYPIQVRSAFLPIETKRTQRLRPGESLTVDRSYIEGLDPGSVDVNVAFSRSPVLDPTGYAASLARYPYGCTEQTVSSGLPLLYAQDIGGIPGYDAIKTKQKMQAAVDRILNRLAGDGSFGLWREGDGYATAWLGAYATEFIQRAKAEGYVVPNDSLDTAYQGLVTITQMESYPSIGYDYGRKYYRWDNDYRKRRIAEATAYAHYVLARGGEGDLSKMRYFYDNHFKQLKTPLSMAHIATSLSMMGDNVRANAAYERAIDSLGYGDDDDYYQSALRDTAGMIALMHEAGQTDLIGDVLPAFERDLKDPSRLNTQEKARTIMAIRALMSDAEVLSVSAQNAVLDSATNKSHLYAKDVEGQPSFTNTGSDDIYLSAIIAGTPLTAPKAFAKGFSMEKDVFDMTGALSDLDSIARGERAIIKVEFNSTINRSRQIVVADLLPAGFEIETVLRPEDGNLRNGEKGAYSWVGKISDFDIIEARDDRLVASLKTRRRDSYIAAYVVRAVTAGTFAMPGATIEDMYRPGDSAVTEGGTLTVVSAKDG